MTKDRLYQKEYARELLAVALEDLEAGKVLAAAGLSRKENILFFAQQAVEKALKAVLCWQEKPVPLTHTLELIIDRVAQCGLSVPYGEELADWTQFATVRRYEEGKFDFTEEEISTVLSAAAEVLSWCRSSIR